MFSNIPIDINECRSKEHDCEEDCINTPGSYYCNCKKGYRLKSDMKTCEGTL